jgi:hypothetical protein
MTKDLGIVGALMCAVDHGWGMAMWCTGWLSDMAVEQTAEMS